LKYQIPAIYCTDYGGLVSRSQL